MSARWLMAGAALAAAVASLAVLVGGGEGDGEGRAGREAPAAGGAAGAETYGSEEERRERPRSPRLPPAPIRMTSGDAAVPPPEAPPSGFAEEEREPGWAGDTEELVRGVLDPLLEEGVEVAGVECRSRHCRISVRGTDPKAFRNLVESMQDDRGFLGVADRLMLSGLSRGEGGARSVDVYLRFD